MFNSYKWVQTKIWHVMYFVLRKAFLAAFHYNLGKIEYVYKTYKMLISFVINSFTFGNLLINFFPAITGLTR